MAHDKHTIHVSHYTSSPTWRTAVTPEDRSWALFIDVTGAPHLYLASLTSEGDGQTATTYTPCVRAMLRAEHADAPGKMPAGVEAIHGVMEIRVGPTGTEGHDVATEFAYTAATEDAAANGPTARAAVVALFDQLAEVHGSLVLAL